ncbi:MAG: single-stranded-DNA-specific exonuclease RecJ [Pusillimonas sp.]|nr:single-stranded-DNA-specific exonuclease RecJ [Pusillimonas sp.]
MVTPKLKIRAGNQEATRKLIEAGIHPLLARLFAARGVNHAQDMSHHWGGLLPPSKLTHVNTAAAQLADAIDNGKKLLVVADYDCDGATACAVAIRALRSMGADAHFLVPNRFETGYGLSPEVVDLATRHINGKPDLIITVDNGIASVDGVETAKQAGIEVLVTDHHLPGDTLPDALAIVNPNQPGCGFPSKNLAGVGVIFYLTLALRAELRRRNVYAADGGPRLDQLADLVALGTVADVVKLDANNRLLVTQGLMKIRKGMMQPGIRALFAVAAREPAQASAFDLGFALGPRINAAGRLADMSLGINCLISNDEGEALTLARELDRMNQERRGIEHAMQDQALDAIDPGRLDTTSSVCVYHPEWHQGVIGLVASRLKEKYWRPTLAFARDDSGQLRGSGRSIPDVHLRDALDLVSKRCPDTILKFGGHAMAAGLTLRETSFNDFQLAFDDAVRTLSGKTRFEPEIETDGSLETGYANAQVAGMLQRQVWGAGFPAPIFSDSFQVHQQRILKDKHLKLTLERDYQRFEAIWFNHATPLPERIHAAYRLDQNIWNGRISAQLIIEYAEAD